MYTRKCGCRVRAPGEVDCEPEEVCNGHAALMSEAEWRKMMSTQWCGCDPTWKGFIDGVYTYGWVCEAHRGAETMKQVTTAGHEGSRTFGTDAATRKAHPVFTGVLMYFPDALAAVANVSKIGNDQHNPGEPLHWAREKSTDQMDTATRHMIDHGVGDTKDSDGAYHLAKAAWRILAELQLTIEKEREGR